MWKGRLKMVLWDLVKEVGKANSSQSFLTPHVALGATEWFEFVFNSFDPSDKVGGLNLFYQKKLGKIPKLSLLKKEQYLLNFLNKIV